MILLALLALLPMKAAWAYTQIQPEYFEDKSASLKIEQIVQQKDWKPIRGKVPSFGYSHSEYWLRFTVPPSSKDPEERARYLEIPYVLLEKMELYSVTRGAIQFEGRTGQGLPVSERDVQRGSFIFRFDGSTDASTVYYLSAQSTYPIVIPLELRNRGESAAHHWEQQFFLGVFFGCLVIAAIFNGFLAVSLKSRLYTYYSLFVVSIGWLYFSLEGFSVHFFWSNSPRWAVIEPHVLMATSLLLYVAFLREILEARLIAPQLNRLLTFLTAIAILRAVWICFNSNLWITKIGGLALVLCHVLAVVITVVGIFKRQSFAIYFFLASIVFNICAVLYMLQVANLIWIGRFFNYLPYYGTVIEITLLSLGLADRIRDTNVQLGKVNKALQEQRVAVIQAEKMSALGRMAGGIAHEINNPLTIIHGKALQLNRLARAEDPDRTQITKIAETIEKTSLRISKIIKSMTTLSRDSASDPPERVAVSTLLQDTLALCTEGFHNEGITLQVTTNGVDFDLHCRSAEICQVLINLLNNAKDAAHQTPEKWVSLEVSRRDRLAEFSITDSGSGIPSAIRDRIHEPFFTTKQVGKGTGLGLSISKTIVENHGGLLWLDQESSNTRFVFTVPIHIKPLS